MDEVLRRHQDFMRHLAETKESLRCLGEEEDVMLLEEIIAWMRES